MTKHSKLSESSARFTGPANPKRNKIFDDYKRNVAEQNNEAAKALRFAFLLQEFFDASQPDFVESYVKGIETYVSNKEQAFVLRGEIDAFFGNAIIEFESNLSIKAKMREAKRQLQLYSYLLLTKNKETETNYLCIATDGLSFSVFVPKIPSGKSNPDKLEQIELKEIESTNLAELSGEEAFLWLDKYLFRRSPLHPTTDNFVHDFGVDSAAYAFASRLLMKEWNRVKSESEYKVIYENWERYLRVAYGTSVADEELFLRHTYLASFAKLLAFMRFSDSADIPTKSEINAIYSGKFFQGLGIENFIDEDFFSWITREAVHDTLLDLTQRLARLLSKYYLNEFSEDVLKSLYQELVDPQSRHDLGEFYTPDWLAERIVRHTLKDNPHASVLDPACGSGSFLYFAIRFKREACGDSKKLLDELQSTVVGMDIHPLAVIIAKTNYLLAVGDLVRRRTREFHIPVYMANSLQIPERQGQPSLNDRVPSFQVNLDNTFVPFPEVFVEHPGAFDVAVDVCQQYAHEHAKKEFAEDRFIGFARKRFKDIQVDTDTLGTLYAVAVRMRELVDKERNSIWSFILKNVYKPIFLREQFDWILGNPPWLSYRYVEKGTYQAFLRSAILNTYGLLAGGKGHLITHMELATLFFFAALKEYGKKGGEVGFVLPRSVFTADQHSNFRTGSFGKAIHHVGLTEVWDLDKVSPLFNVPSCVVFGKRPHHTAKPIKAEVIAGSLPSNQRNAQLKEAEPLLSVRKTKLHVAHQGERTLWSEDPKAEIVGSSHYLARFNQGATLVPRTCWFVQIKADNRLGFNPDSPYVITDKRATEQAKEAYATIVAEGNIEKEFLYATLLSTDLLPFAFLDYRPVVLPIRKLKVSDTFAIVTAEDARKEGFSNLEAWLHFCEKEWISRRKGKSGNETLLGWLDYRKKLTEQHFSAAYKVIYPTSASNLCSAVVQNQRISIVQGDQRIRLASFIVDHKLYCFDTERESEANYLCALFNAKTIDNLIKPMQSRGQWGPRDIHKKVLELPIPLFDEKKKSHMKLAELGIRCAEKVTKFKPSLDLVDVTPGKIGRLRGQVREHLKDELGEIDEIVRGIMKV